jgi:cellobiose phosphorylase
MKYGYFDNQNNEYVITRPDTPKSWSNYLGSTKYGAIITNNAGGYSFYKSGGMGRFLRMRFNSIPMDQPGRYIYLRDKDDGDFWSGSWQPVGKGLDKFKSICRHGMGYTIITSEYKKIESEITYFVPIKRNFEIWKVKIKNKDKKPRNLSTFSYTEYAGNWHAIDDLLNIQYVQYISKMKVIDGIIDHGTNINLPELPDDFKEKDQGRHTFQALVGQPVTGFDTDREAFLGNYRTYANPEVVEQGQSKESLGYGDNPCGSLKTDLELKPGESKEFLIILGIGRAREEGQKIASEFSDIKKADQELEKLKEYWQDRISGISASTPDKKLNTTINTWGIYNSMVTFAWSRAASLVYSGIDRDGLGYRDTVQDFLGVMHSITDEVRERLELMLTGQASSGGAVPVILPIAHSPGKLDLPEEEDYRSDDCMWLFNAVPDYVKETGNIDFYNKVLPYADQGEDTVFGHLKKAIQFNLKRSGEHDFPYGLAADWNDCLEFGTDGESIFVAMQLRYALDQYIEIARLLNEHEEEKWARDILTQLDKNLDEYAWDGEWFIRGYSSDGTKFGSRESEEGKIYMNTQAWSIISGTATLEQARQAMQKVNEKLATKYGIMICDPPYTKSDHNIIRAQLMNPGLKENAGIFIHTQSWAVIAETMLGHGKQAYQYLKNYLPVYYNDKADLREIEPYVLCQSTHSKYSPKFGVSRIPWLSGSASWTYYAITRYLLGIRPEYDGLRIDPCIPADWDGFEVSRKFRGKNFDISVKNENNHQKGVKEVSVNGKKIQGNLIPADIMKESNKVTVIM